MRHLLVTNDYPPKVGGIQSYLWELWRRLDGDDVAVLTSPYQGAASFDAAAPHRIERTRAPWLLPGPGLERRIEALARDHGAEALVLDPVLPLGLLGRRTADRLGIPWLVVAHGAEITVPRRLPGARALLRGVLTKADGVIAAGGYPLAQCRAAAAIDLAATVVPPGVDTSAILPLDAARRSEVRGRFGFDPETPLVLGLSRLVPRKGFDRLIQAAHRLASEGTDLSVVIAGDGRDRGRLQRLADDGPASIVLLGRVSDRVRAELFAAADLFAMLCRDRWVGLEQEGFGIVFLEAASAGVPAIAGRSGGSHEAVDDGVTGTVVDAPDSVDAVADALADAIANPERLRAEGRAARRRAVERFDYAVLARQLDRDLRRLVTGRSDG